MKNTKFHWFKDYKHEYLLLLQKNLAAYLKKQPKKKCNYGK